MSTLRSDILNITTDRTAVLPPSEREQLVLSLLQHVTPLVKKLARDWHLDYDDAYQEASIHIMRLLDNGKTLKEARNLPAVISYCVRQQMIKLSYSTQRHTLQSIDMPTHPDSDLTIADLLPSPYSHDPLSIILTQERLKQLEPKVQGLRGPHSSAVRVRYETALAEVSA